MDKDTKNIPESEAGEVREEAETNIEGEGAISDGATEPSGAMPDEKIEELTQQLAKARDDYLRLVAEFDNYKKRTNREFSALIKTANESLITNLLDVLDNFERAFKSREENFDADAYHKGIKLLYDKLYETLTREGLARFDSVGQPFDPKLHEAVVQVESEDAAPDTVALEIQPGYMLGDKVIRHARVGVVKPKEES